MLMEASLQRNMNMTGIGIFNQIQFQFLYLVKDLLNGESACVVGLSRVSFVQERVMGQSEGILGRWSGCVNFTKLFLEVVIKQAPVAQTLDSAIHRINHYPTDNYWGS